MLSTIGRTAIWRGVASGSQSVSQSIGRWTKLRQVRVGHVLQTDLRPRALLLWRRHYSKDTAATRKPRTRTSPSKAKKPQKRNTRAVKRKAKSKARPKKKSSSGKRGRKPLTKEQKDKLEAKKKGQEIKSLKAIALLSPPKQLPSSPWLVLAAEFTKNNRPVTNAVKEASLKYKSLDISEKERYNNIADQNKIANGIAFKKWVESHSPDQINEANKARAKLKRRLGERGSSKYSPIRDSRLPKTPGSARSMFLSERWKSEDVKNLSFAEANKTIFKEWSELSPSQRKPFEDAATADKKRYEQEYKTVFQRDLHAQKPSAKSSE